MKYVSGLLLCLISMGAYSSDDGGDSRESQKPIVIKRLLNLDYNGKAAESEVSSYRGPLAYGKDEDLWNSAATSAWPLTPEALDNTRSNLKWSDGSAVEGNPTLRIQNLGQYWDAFAGGPSRFGIHALAFENWSYSDMPGPGVSTLSGIPEGVYDIVAYSPPTIPSFQTFFRVNVIGSNDQAAYDSGLSSTSNNNDDQLLHEWKEGVQLVTFRGIEIKSGEKLVIQAENGKKHVSAIQIIETAPGSEVVKNDHKAAPVETVKTLPQQFATNSPTRNDPPFRKPASIVIEKVAPPDSHTIRNCALESCF